ncbi:MAG: hypothetical protein IMZ63_00735 [Actinobacteria bacterium]|nr:hypothetical protein [Chloroflexota bacterium]MBE3138320.1 hypothetical protein [Actinomycetota bacterium]
MRRIDWVSLVIGVTGGIIIANLLRLSDISIYTRYKESMFVWLLPIIISLIGIFLLVFKFFIRKEKIRVSVDERIRTISDRSARNGLLATYLPLFILLTLDIPPDAKSLLIAIATGFFVWLISFYFYYYRKA